MCSLVNIAFTFHADSDRIRSLWNEMLSGAGECVEGRKKIQYLHIYIKQYLFLGSRSKNISVPCCGSCHRIQHPRRPSSLSCHWRELFLRATANVHRSIIIVVTSCSSDDTWSTHPVKPTKIFILPRISFTSHSIKWCPALLIICTIIYTR